jgi:hypothetical protein
MKMLRGNVIMCAFNFDLQATLKLVDWYELGGDGEYGKEKGEDEGGGAWMREGGAKGRG